MNSKLLVNIVLFVLGTAVTFAQTSKSDLSPCGTQDGIIPWLKEFQQHIDGYPESGDLLLVPIKIHIVGTSAGAGYFPVQSVMDAFCTLNEDYVPANIQFFISGEFNYIDNTNFYDHNWQQGAQMMDQNNVDNTINCYIVESPAGNCGYSAYNRGIALAKSCMAPNDHTWAHEVGHYLSLPHPFFGWEGYDHDYSLPAPNQIDGYPVEKMDGSNCTVSGDGFCDTAPDYLNFRWGCDATSFSNQVQHDPDNVEFTSDGSLFMSYAFDECSGRFSNDQIAAMRANLNDERFNLLNQADPIPPVDSIFLNAISPVDGDTLDGYEMVEFEWDPVPNATQYVVEISTFSDFPFVLFSYMTETPNITVTDLFRNKNYFWRIRAFNNQHTCETEASEPRAFRTGTDLVNAVSSLESVMSLTVYPNPVSAGQTMRVNLTSQEPVSMQVSLASLTGQTVNRYTWQVAGGEQTFELPTEGLVDGIYFLQLQTAEGVISRKIVVGL